MDIKKPISRLSFIQTMISSGIACMFLPGAMRHWKMLWIPSRPLVQSVRCKEFADFLLRETPRYDALIVQDIAPTDGWISHVSVANWDKLSPFDPEILIPYCRTLRS